MKKIVIIISIILVVLGLVFGGVVFVKNFNEDQAKTLAVMEQIKEEYNNFSPYVEKFSSERTKFYTETEEMFFLENIDTNREAINQLLVEYNDIVMEAHDKSAYLRENCDRQYASSSVNNTCNLFKQGYEAIINYYITDIDVYNNVVEEYNNWLTENSLEQEPLAEIQFDLYKDYIDYDKDGSYLGGK